MEKRWYVVQAQHEARAQINLRRQGFDAWLPQTRRVDSVLAPLFPGYLFVRLDLKTARWRSINGTFGVIRLLCSGDTPLALPEGLVEEIMQRCDAPLPPPRRPAVGEAVKVAFGPFAGLEGLFEEMSGRDRVLLLFDLLGRKVRADVPVVEIAP